MEAEAEIDRDSLVPGTGSINGDLDENDVDEESDVGEDITEEDEEEENMTNVVQGTTETIINKLEENLSQVSIIKNYLIFTNLREFSLYRSLYRNLDFSTFGCYMYDHCQ